MTYKGPEYRGDGWAVMADGTSFWGVLGAAGLFLVTPDDHVLVQLRAAWTNRGGTWAIPGGARNPDETAAQAALRETWEETSVDTDLITVLGDVVTVSAPLDHVLRREPVLEEEEYLLEPVKELVERTGDPREALKQQPVHHPSNGGQAIFGLGARWWWQIQDHDYNDEWSYTTVIAECDKPLEFSATSESTDLAWHHIDELEQLDLLPAFRDALPAIREELKALREKCAQ